MTKCLNFALKIKGVVGRVAYTKSSDPATPPKFETCTLRKKASIFLRFTRSWGSSPFNVNANL